MSHPRKWIAPAGAALSAMLVVAVLGLRECSLRLGWRAELEQQAAFARSLDPSKSDPVVREHMLRLQGDVLVRPDWGTAEVDELLADLDASQHVPATEVAGVERTDRTSSEYESIIRVQLAMSTITQRMSARAPISGDGQYKLTDAMVGLLSHGSPRVRLSATTHVVQSGLADEDGPARDRVIALQQDPDPTVARNALNQLQARDKNRRRASR